MNSSSTFNTILISVIVVAILYLARDVLIPIALAWILSFMLEPPVRILQKLRVPWGLHVPRWSAVLVVVLVVFGAIFALGGIMAHQSDSTCWAFVRLPGDGQRKGSKARSVDSVSIPTARAEGIFVPNIERAHQADTWYFRDRWHSYRVCHLHSHAAQGTPQSACPYCWID